MLSFILVSVVLGLATAAPQGFPQETASNQAARAAFQNEFNRLAALAANAPDIHIITASHGRIDDPSLNHIVPQQQQFAPQQPQFAPQQFAAPQQQTFVQQQPAFVPQQQQQSSFQNIEPAVPVWTGPLADTIPAGVNGLPVQVMDTPEVAAAKAAHFAAHNAAFQVAPQQQTQQRFF